MGQKPRYLVGLAFISALAGTLMIGADAVAQGFNNLSSFRGDGPPPPPPPVHHIPPPPPPLIFIAPPPPPPPPPPPSVTPPSTPPQIHFEQPAFLPPFPTIKDATSVKTLGYIKVQIPGVQPTAGLKIVSDEDYSKQAKSKGGPSEWIVFRPDDGTNFEKVSPFAGRLDMGQVLISVRRPSHVGILETPAGEISVAADGDVIVKWDADVIRIFNLSARGAVCKIKLNEVVFGNTSTKIVSIAPGYELVAGGRKITRSDVRPHDGIARRYTQLLANGRIAISEFSVESMLTNSALIASLQQEQAGPKGLKIANDISKMAAVLNAVNGDYGYTTEGQTQTGVAAKPGAGPH